MKLYKNPLSDDWPKISERNQKTIVDKKDLVKQIFDDVIKNGDKAVLKYAKKFDGFISKDFLAREAEISSLARKTDKKTRLAIDTAYENIKRFQSVELPSDSKKIETEKGVICWQEIRPINSVGLYVPGGSAPLISTVLMLGIPAQLAGCKNIVMCSPPNNQGGLNPAICYAAKKLGIRRIYKIGGVQAIAAMTIGTKSVPKVDKIFGPGNQYVMAAKQYAINYGVAIDMPAGPSEVMVIADESANPKFVAADLLSQAEHGPDSQVVLLSTNQELVNFVKTEIKKQLESLPRKDIAKKSIDNSFIVLFDEILDVIDFANEYAPEHLIINTKNLDRIAAKINNAGSIFIGGFSPESAGDYASGTNHTLPTSGWAKSYSGLSVRDFTRTMSLQKLSKNGIKNLAGTITTIARAEGLEAHARAVEKRL